MTPPPPSQRLSDAAAAARGTTRARLAKALARDLDWITLRALEKEPARRYASASELSADLRRHLQGEAVLAGPPSARYRLGKFVRRHRFPVASASAALLVLVAATITTSMAWLDARAARDAARRQAAESLAVTRFMRSMWSFARPSGQESGVIPAVALLDEASQALDDALANETSVRITLRSTLGEINLDLERLAEAEREMRAALALGRSDPATSPKDLATLTHNLASVLAARSNWVEAEPLARAALELRIAALGDGHIDVAASLDLLARERAFAGQTDEALALARRAWEIAAREEPTDSLRATSIASNLATYLRDSGDLDAARALLEQVSAARQRTLGADHPDTLAALSNLALVWHRQGRHAEAAATFEAILAAQERLFGPEHLAISWRALATTSRRSGSSWRTARAPCRC
ncbi:MAG: tetratricopeptide repeat protein [Planctomycetota bacterium]